ncbi:MAG: polysaccharide export protein [Proteobacteria bacterium]|nr:polysaccharide export protein [Pseudomonadota bacterium]
MKIFTQIYGGFLLALCFGFLSGATAAEQIIGPGDVLQITVYDNDDLTTTVRVSEDESITMPLLGQVSVKGRSISSIIKQLEALYADGYLVNPQVNVFVKEYRSRKVVVLGQISNPGLYELSGNTTILELISKAGGLAKDAGSTAIIQRKGEDGHGEKMTVDLRQLVEKGDTSVNLVVKDGDSIHISKAGEFFITGEVSKPDSYKYEEGLTVIKAITMAGGFTGIAARSKIQLIRKVDGQEKIIKNLKLDTVILPDDVIVVPESFF